MKILPLPGETEGLDIGILKSFPTSLLLQKGEDPRWLQGNSYIYGNSIILDAFSRDFTINAIYFDILDEVIYDPCMTLSQEIRGR